jgi:hypothetical protein
LSQITQEANLGRSGAYLYEPALLGEATRSQVLRSAVEEDDGNVQLPLCPICVRYSTAIGEKKPLPVASTSEIRT